MSISNQGASSPDKPFVVLEIANNHMGDFKHGKRLILALSKVVRAYTDIFDFGIKFQFRELDTFIHPDHRGSSLKYVKRFEETILSNEEWQDLFSLVKMEEFTLVATPFDESSVQKCIENNVDIIKIASCSLADWPLIECVARTGRPVIFSTAGSNIESIDAMISFFGNRGIDASLMHCVGIYPTPDESLNIGQIRFFKNRYPNNKVGYSTHEDPSHLETGGLAIALGAQILEKHVGLPSTDYQNNAYSVTPDQLGSWLEVAHRAVCMIGEKENKASNSKKEVDSLRDLQRGVFARKSLKAGKRLTADDVYFAIPSVEGGYTANDFSKYSEFVVSRDISENELISVTNTDVCDRRHEVKNIVDKTREFLKQRNISIPKGAILEISHHYGIANYFETGLSMITIVNEEYCKKLLFLLPGQNHPEQYHKRKKETFHILHGDLQLCLDGNFAELNSGDVCTIDQMVKHQFSTISGCVIEEISSTHQAQDSFYTDERVYNNENRKTFVNFWL